MPEELEKEDHLEQMFLEDQSFPSVLCGQMGGTLSMLGAHRPSYCTFNVCRCSDISSGAFIINCSLCLSNW